uniref:ribonuclease H n=1 Tax=Nothobranchius furzeri TaxID=105023 RepID=A0A8C6LCJ1_NOTFU
MDSVRPPEAVVWTGNVDCEWRSFKQRFMLYLQAVGLDSKPDVRKIALLLTVAGPRAVEVFNTFVFEDEEDQHKFDVVLQRFDDHCSPKKNETFERYVFRARLQQQDESFDVFLTDLKLKARTCNFGILQDSLIRDQVVFGIHDTKVREKLLRETDLTLIKAVDICHACEIARHHVKAFGDGAGERGMEPDVAAVSCQRKCGQDKERSFSCRRCGTRHALRQCPAFGKMCNSCKGLNHFSKYCFSKKKPEKHDPVHTVEEASLSETFFVGLVERDADVSPSAVTCGVKVDKWTVPLLVNGTVFPVKLDTGAKANLINERDIEAMDVKPLIRPASSTLKAYNGQSIITKGKCTLTVHVKGKEHDLEFIVVPEGHDSLIGDEACERLGLVHRVYHVNGDPHSSAETIVGQYPDVFEGFGALPYTYKIHLKDNARPVVHAPRRVPGALRCKLKHELDRMTLLGVIRKVEAPTEWVNSMVCVKKPNGDLRICMDPKDLNDNIKREHYLLPTREEIVSEMSGATLFSKLDASHGFWQIKLEDESSKLCTFNTPFGRYQFLRMPFGITSAPEVFHRTMEYILEGLDGVRVYVDDIIIWGATVEQHNERLVRVLQRIRANGLKLNKAKCQFGVREIVFLGDQLSGAGVKPDDRKIKAILEMPCPADKKAVLRALGMINFVGKFIPNLSSKTLHLRQLLHEKQEFSWTGDHDDEWKRLKHILTSEPVLMFYDPQRQTKISTDASTHGIGAVLLQHDGDDWRPVAYASRAMTAAECRYAQIEKECLGLVYGFEKFHNFVYGLPRFLAETDHKPLVSIVKKNLSDMSPRLQRLMMKLLSYDFELIYTPGKQIVFADALSRAVPLHGAQNVGSIQLEVEVHVDMIKESLPVTDRKSKRIADETAKDEILQRVMNKLQGEWPKGECQQYFTSEQS